MNKSDLWTGLALMGLGFWITRQALRLDYIDEYGPGPGFFPVWIGAGLLALATGLVIMSIFRRAKPSEEQPAWSGTGRALGAWAGFMMSIALLNTLGFFISFVMLTIFLVSVMNRRSPWLAAIVGLGGALGFYFLFVVALGVPIPVGPWGF